jgi:Family of unknown function (DUF5677)
MSEPSFDDGEAFRLAEELIEKLLTWSQSFPAPSNTPVLSFVKFRAFYRAVKQYSCVVQLLRSGQWEDALILARSLYELNANLSEIACASDPEEAARRFVRFGKCQHLRLERRNLEDELRDENLKPQSSTIVDLKKKLAAITSDLNRTYGEFRKNGKWQDTWSGFSVETLARHLAQRTGANPGQSDYFVYALGSLFTHGAPGALFLGLANSRETVDRNEFRALLDKAGGNGLRFFLVQASECLIDIIGLAGDSIGGYERQWFDGFALPLLKKFLARPPSL